MKTILKRVISAALGAGAVSLIAVGAACAKKDESSALLKESKIWLDSFEECALPVKDGVDVSSLSVTSDREDLVRYENGTIIGTGKAKESTEVVLTVAQGKTTSKLAVQVRDSGEVPVLEMPDPSVYLGVAIDLPVKVMYHEQEMPVDITKYEVSIADEDMAFYENGQIEGLALGSTTLTIDLEYKGINLSKEDYENDFAVQVKKADILEFNVSSLEIYQADSKLSKAQLVPKVVKGGHVIENAAVKYEVIEGAGNLSVSESGAVQAIKSGAAKIRATYLEDSSVYGDLPVTIKENYVKETLSPTPVGGIDPADFGACSDLLRRAITVVKTNEDKNEKQLTEVCGVIYDDCSPFGVIAGDFGKIENLSKHTFEDKEIDKDTLKKFNEFGAAFSKFMAQCSIPEDGAKAIFDTAGDDWKNYAEAYKIALEIYGRSLLSSAHIANDDFTGSAVIGLNQAFSVTFGKEKDEKTDKTAAKSETEESVDYLQLAANLFGFTKGEFSGYAQSLADTLAECRAGKKNAALENGFVSTENGSYVFPVVVNSENSVTVLTYVIADETGRVSLWINDVAAALKATNFNRDNAAGKVESYLACKNVLFIAGAKQKTTALEKEEGTIGGRSSSDMQKLKLGYIKNESNGNTDMWSHRALVSSFGTNFVEAYRKGYRYFAYDLYYTDGETIKIGNRYYDEKGKIQTGDKEYHKSTNQLYVGSGGDASHEGALCEFISFDQYFHRSYMRVLQENGDGEWEETGVLRKNQWVRIVYDLKYYAFNYPNAVIGFFFTSGQVGATAYFDNMRYYLDGAFLPEETRAYEEKDGYVQANNEELHLYGVDTGTKYEKAEEGGAVANGEHAGAYKYTTPDKKDSWKNALIVTLSDDSSIGVGMLNLTQHGNYLTFDFYAENAENLSITLGHSLYSKTYRLTADGKLGSSLEPDLYVAAYQGSNRLYTIPQGEWVTISLAFREAYRPVSGWSRASIFIALTGANETAYIDNIRYYQTNEHIPANFIGERPVYEYYVTSDLETLTFASAEADGADFAGTVKYTSTLTNEYINANEGWHEGLKFSNVNSESFHPAGDFYSKGNHYITFKMYVTGNFGGISLYSHCNDGRGGGGGIAWSASIRPGVRTSRDVYLMDENGVYARFIEKDTWYTLTIPVEYVKVPSNWSSVYYRLLKGDGEEEAIAYVKELKYHRTRPAEVPREKDEILNVKLADPKGGSQETVTEEGEFAGAEKYTLLKSGDWQSALILCDSASPAAAAKYVTFELYFKDVSSFYVIDQLGTSGGNDKYNYRDDRKIDEIKKDGTAAFYDTDGNRVFTLHNGMWYKVAVPVQAVKGNDRGALRMFFTFSFGETQATVYVRNADYGNEDIYAK